MRGSSARRSPTGTTAGWRTTASTRPRTRSRTTARPAPRCTTSIRGCTTAPRTRSPPARDGRSSSTTAPDTSDRRRAHPWYGAETRRPTGASTACPEWSAWASTTATRASGSTARTSAATCRSPPRRPTPELLDPLARVRRLSRRHAHDGRRPRPPLQAGHANLGPERPADLAAVRQAAHAAVPVHRKARSPPTRPGVPPMEGLGLAYPNDAASWTGPPRYLLGPDLLVAPVVAPASGELTVPLPPGRWPTSGGQSATTPGTEASTSAAPRCRAAHDGCGSERRSSRSAARPRRRAARAAPADVATLAGYGTGVVHLKDRARQLHLLAWPRGTGSTLALGTRLRSVLDPHTWTLTVSRRPARIDIEAALAGKSHQSHLERTPIPPASGATGKAYSERASTAKLLAPF